MAAQANRLLLIRALIWHCWRVRGAATLPLHPITGKAWKDLRPLRTPGRLFRVYVRVSKRRLLLKTSQEVWKITVVVRRALTNRQHTDFARLFVYNVNDTPML